MPNVVNLKNLNKKPQPIKQESLSVSVKSVPISVIGAAIFVAIAVIILSLTLFRGNIQPTQAASWFNDDWHYRQQFDVFNASTTEDLVDFQVELATSTLALRTAWSAGKLRNDFKDLRFTDNSGNLLDYWFPNATSTMGSVYVKFPTLPKNATSTLMMYYGNPSAVDKRDGAKVFPDFFEDFADGNYTTGVRNWQVTSGTYSIAGSDKYLNNSTAGVIGAPLTKAYGTWEFSLYKGADANSSDIWFTAPSITTASQYGFRFDSDESVSLREDAAALLTSAASYIANTTWYRLKITRTIAGVFTVYIKGGTFGSSSWTTVGTATDTTYATSAFFVPDLDASDRIDNILWRKFATTDPSVVATAGTSEETGGGPVGYWSFDEGYGATAYDRSGIGKHGTLTNMSTTGTSTAWVTGKVNKALQFDGSNDYVNVGNVNKTVNSVSFWLNAKNLTKDIIDFDGGTHYVTVSAGTLSATGFTSPTIYVDGKASTKIKANTWHYITVTTATGFTASNLKLGLKTTYFQGLLDEVKIYNYALSASQILAEYNKNKSVILSLSEESRSDKYQGLIGYWPMDEATTTWDGAGDRVNDYSGNGNNGTASGHAHATTTAKYGNAGEFDGTDDYVDCGAASNFGITNKVTVLAWFKVKGVPGGGYHIVFMRGSVDIELDVSQAGLLRTGITNTAGTRVVFNSSSGLADGNWHFLSLTYDGNLVKGYADGIFTGSSPQSGLVKTAGSAYIGYLSGYYANGLIDDVKIYNTARTADQIMLDYLQGPGPIASYNFEEKSGTTVNDISGRGNNGTITAGASKGFVKGKIGRSYDFDGANTKIVTTLTDNSQFQSGFTISAWIRPDGLGENNNGTIIGKAYDPSGLSVQGFRYGFETDGTLGMNVGAQTVRKSGTISIGVWSHVLVTVASNATVTHYINGVVSGTPGTSGALSSIITTNPVIIGNRYALPDRTFDGKIDDLKVYNYVLTPWQIAQEYNQGRPSAQWSFDEGQGTTANNTYATSTGQLAGTLTNMSTTGTSTAWTTGKFGKALLFDGANDTVAVTDTTGSALDIRSAGSLSAWIRPSNVSGNKYIIDKAENTAYALLLSGSAVKGYFGNSSCSGGKVLANQWSYVSVAWDGAYIRCYLNGTQVAQTAYSTALTAQNTSLYIGSDGGAASWFKGLIDEPKIYQYALSPVQIKKDYNDGLAVQLGGLPAGEASGLVGWWKMDEATTTWDGAGDRVNDYSGLGNHGTASGHAHATTTAKYGNAAEFDGTDDSVTIADSNSLDMTNQITIEAWVYRRGNSGDAYNTIIRKSSAYEIVITESNRRVWWALGTANYWAVNNTNYYISNSEWHHLVLVYDKNTGGGFYVDGNLINKIPANGAISASANNLSIGDGVDIDWDFNGLIDDVKIYNTARTPDQIMQDYLQGPGPIASYNFEEKSGTTVNDLSGRGNNGTITPGASKGFVKGKIGRAYDFDGANTKISSNIYSQLTGAFTISAWVKPNVKTKQAFVGFGSATNYIALEHGDTGRPIIILDPNNYRYFVSSAYNTLTNGNWHHVVFVITGSGLTDINNSAMYIDGLSQSVLVTTQSNIPQTKTDFFIGSEDSSPNYPFKGIIDDLKVWNYVLTPWQIAQEYNQGKTIAYYKMDEGEGSTIRDWSGKGYNGTLSLGASPATSTAWQTQTGCKVNKCLAFDGTNDYAGLSSSLTVATEATVSAWIRPNTVASGALVIAGDSNSGNNTQQLSLQINNTAGKISGKWGNSTIITSKTGLTADSWYYVTLTRSGSTGAWTAKIYINGVLDNIATTATNPSTVSSWSIGRNGAVAGSYFNGKIDDLKIYAYALSPLQIKNDFNAGFGTYFKDEWQCGDYLVDGRDSQSYNTVQIGTQCWMAQNLNVGTQINSPAAASVATACTGHIGETLTIDGTSCYCETDTYASCQLNGAGGAIQKYCYSNTASYCTAEGGLYEWQQTMNLAGSCAHSSCTPASGNKGICPSGWHVPTDTEFKTLEMNQGMSQAQVDATGWRGNKEGDKLKSGGLCQGRTPCATSGFKAPLAGYRNVTGSFNNRGSRAYFWSSSQNSAAYSWSRSLNVSYSTVYRFTYTKYYGFSVRCIKD